MDTFITIAGLFITFIVIIVVAALVLALPIMWLWNDLMPGLFGLRQISFGDAVELGLLSGLLFKSANTGSSKD